MLRAGTLRTAWAVGAVAVVATARSSRRRTSASAVFDNELEFRGQSHASLEALFRNPKVRAGLKCGPVSVPNHKLVPDTRWVLDAGVDDVIARSDPKAKARIGRGVAVYATSRQRSCARASRRTTRRPRTSRTRCRCPASPGSPQRPTTAPMSAVESAPSRAARATGGDARGPGSAAPARPTGGGRGRAVAVLDRPRGGPRGRSRPAAVGCRAGPAVRLQRRRERALRPRGDRPVRPRPEPALLRQPARLHVPAARRVRRCGSAAARASRTPTRSIRPRCSSSRVSRPRSSARRRVAAVPRRRAPVPTGASACSPPRCWPSRFLPVFYSHLALNDVPTLAPIALSLWGTAGVLRTGRLRDYALAGIGLGLTCATKYTGGIVLLPLLAAGGDRPARARGRRGERRRAVRPRRPGRSPGSSRSRRSSSRTRSRVLDFAAFRTA